MPGARCISRREIKALHEGMIRENGPKDGSKKFRQHFKEALQEGHLKPHDFSIAELFEALVVDGRGILEHWRNPKSNDTDSVGLLEAGLASAVGYSDFSNITGQIFFTEIMSKYDDEEFVFSKAIEHKQSSIQDIEKIAGISRLGDQFLEISEGGTYQRFGVSENYIEVGPKKKRGAIVEVTKEAVAGDLTGKLLENCGELGHYLGLNGEKRVIDAIIDENGGAVSAHLGGHRYTWRGTAYATYQTSMPWINSKTSNPLLDYTSIKQAWLQMAAITDPFTQEPILINPDTIIVAPDLVWEANRIMTATMNRTVTPGYATSANPVNTEGPNLVSKVAGNMKILTSRLLKARLATDTNWFLGNPRKAVRRYYNWDITPQQRGANTDADFERDVVLQYKASLKDVVAVIEPRVLQKNAA
jgi:hypothetical protein